MPLGDFGSSVSSEVSTEELADLVSRLVKEVSYLLNGGLDTLNVNELSADVINAGVLNAVLVVIKAINGSYSYTFDSTGIKANNGTVDTLKFDLATGLLTIVSALIQSATGYPRVELNSASTLISAFADANNHLDIAPTYGGSPAVVWTAASNPVASIGTSTAITTIFSAVQMLLQANGNLNLATSGNLNINGSTGQTGTVYVSATPGGPANIAISFTKGIRTS